VSKANHNLNRLLDKPGGGVRRCFNIENIFFKVVLSEALGWSSNAQSQSFSLPWRQVGSKSDVDCRILPEWKSSATLGFDGRYF